MKKITTSIPLVFLAQLVLVSTGWAQADAVAGTPAAVTPVVPEAPAPKPAAVTEDASDDKDESIYIVQRRVYSKSGKFELTPMFFTSLNNKFVGHYGVAVGAAYHLRENLAIELMTTIPYVTQSFYSALVFEVYDQESLTPEVVDLKKMTYFGSANIDFSALYGKMEFYGWLIDYDFYLTSGFGLATTLETCVPKQDGCGADDQHIGRGLRAPEVAGDRYKLTGNLGGGMRFFFRDYVGLRLEVRDVVYSDRAEDAGEVFTDIRNNVLFMAGLSFLL